MRLIHTAITVSDLDAMLDFYGELGLSKTGEFTLNGVENVYVGSGDGLEIQFKHDPKSEEAVDPAGIDHLAVEVDDADEAFEELVAATGCPVVRDPFDVDPAGARAAFVEDPDGYVVELVEYLK
ncbi:putative lactoyglutathione lyase [Halogeometricum pallidum JCM 14848]|uniref:Putative lactoyglutathione lyase n=1 Tax=Halogeometricum pallidum JCM 14848 TaxID=1227487 RepID=M0D4K7_HALPD|nr:VOC family protein [Halogeometricum pallidum]ELZ30385.1 putative lactoyglutathione lyase [Halogeometricum pallidum JCM 14848]